MSNNTDDFLAFKDYEDYGESPQISVNSPIKKQTQINDGKISLITNFIENLIDCCCSQMPHQLLPKYHYSA